MKIVLVATDNATKFAEIAEMLALHGCEAIQAPADAMAEANIAAGGWRGLVPDGAAPAAIAREQTTLRDLPDGQVEHESKLAIRLARVSEADGVAWDPQTLWIERTRGRLNGEGPAREGAYDWDSRFVPAGSALTLDELKLRGLKVSARQLAVGAWLRQWLDYAEPTAWRHMRPTDSVAEWLAEQPLLQSEATAPTRAIVERVHQSGAWLKASENRRVKHYWWPGLNAGIPMTPKKDYVHELTFLIHDLIHWAMPDTVPSARSEVDHRLYVATRMMSEAITLVMADMAFIEQALAAGLAYDTGKRKIHPLFDSGVPLDKWCRAMSHYAIRGDDRRLAAIAKSPEALEAFKAKYAPFFEEDLRWTAHNARHLQNRLDPRWIELHAQFARGCDLRLTSTRDCRGAWSEDDEALVDQVFDWMWSIHWGTPPAALDGSVEPGARRMQRWWLGQLALTLQMDDLPLSGIVREKIVAACLGRPTAQELRALVPAWNSYVDALAGLSRLSGNDAAIFKTHYPIVPPLYVSYDRGTETYKGIAATWAAARSL
jgi:hypothetical protein